MTPLEGKELTGTWRKQTGSQSAAPRPPHPTTRLLRHAPLGASPPGLHRRGAMGPQFSAPTACKKLPSFHALALNKHSSGNKDGDAPTRDSEAEAAHLSQHCAISTSECPYLPCHVILTTGQACGLHSMPISAGPLRGWAPGQLSQTSFPLSRLGDLSKARLEHVSSISHPNPATTLHILEAPGHPQAVLLTCKSVPDTFGCCRFPRASSLPR